MRLKHSTVAYFILGFAAGSLRSAIHESPLDKIWRVKLHKFTELRKAQIESISRVKLKNVPEREAYDLIEPVLSCELETRFGAEKFNRGDGPKFTCGVDLLANDKECIVYSIGSAYDFKFEFAVRRVSKECEIHTFDGTMDLETRPLPQEVFQKDVRFHNWNIVSDCAASRYDTPSKCVRDTLRILGHKHRVITWLKIDCESCEFAVVPQLLQHVPRIDQIMMEVHGTNAEQIMSLFQSLRNAGMEVFHKERNHWGCDGYLCVEFSLMSLEYAKRALALFVEGTSVQLLQ